MERKHQWHIWYVIGAVLALLLLQDWLTEAGQTEVVPYNQFESFLKAGDVEQVTIGQQYISGTFKEARNGKTQFVTPRIDPALAQDLSQYNVKFIGTAENTFLRTLLSWIVPIVIFFAIWMFFFRKFAEKQGLGGFMTVGKSQGQDLRREGHQDDLQGRGRHRRGQGRARRRSWSS